VVPCYSEEGSLPELHRRVSKVLRKCTDRYEIVLANDGSRDATLEVIRGLARHDKHVRGVDLARNFGHQLCLTAALDHARGEVILMIDADLQDPPELLPRMLKRWREGVDVVYAVRRKRKGENFFKLATASLFYRLLKSMTKINIPLDTGDFRLIDRRALDAVLSLRETNRFLRGLFTWVGFRQEPVYYVRQERFAGETHYPLTKMMRFALDGITSFSHKPLQFAVWLGLFAASIAFVYAVRVLWEGLRGGTVSGWASNTFAILFLGGVQLFTIGLLGEYIGRIFEEVKGRPLYVVREVIEQDNNQDENKREKDSL
jgi:dolichol-phosphate mannosyltransferase